MRSKIFTGVILTVFVVGAIQADTIRVGLLGGLNSQSYDGGQVNIRPGTGWSVHGGINVEFFFTPGCLPAQLGLELELLRQNARYDWDTPFQGLYSTLVLNNTVIPLMPKLRVGIIPKTDFEFGLGLSLIKSTSGYWRLWGSGGGLDVPINANDLETDLGFVMKADVGYMIAPFLLIVPNLRYQLNLTADNPDTQTLTEKEHAFFFGVGLELGF